MTIDTPLIDLQLGDGPDAYDVCLRSEHLVELLDQCVPYLGDADLHRVAATVGRLLMERHPEVARNLSGDSRRGVGLRSAEYANAHFLMRILRGLMDMPNAEPATP